MASSPSKSNPYLALNDEPVEVNPYLAQNDETAENPYLAQNPKPLEIPVNVPKAGMMLPPREVMDRAGEMVGKTFDTVLPEVPQSVVDMLPDGQAGWAPSPKGSAEFYNNLRSGQPIIPSDAISTLPQWVQDSLKNTPILPTVTGLAGQVNPGSGLASQGLNVKTAAEIGIGTTNAAAMAVPFLTSPGGAATLAAPAVLGPMVGVGFAAEAIPQLPEVGREIGEYIKPGPKPSEFERNRDLEQYRESEGYEKPIDPNSPNLPDLITKTVGVSLMSAGVLPVLHTAGSKLQGMADMKAGRLANEAAAQRLQQIADQARVDAEFKRMEEARGVQEAEFRAAIEVQLNAEKAQAALTPPAPSPLAAQIDQTMGIARPTGPAARSAEVLLADQAKQSAADLARGLETREAIASAQGGNMERAIAGRQGATPEVQPNPAEVQKKAFEQPYAPTDPAAPELPPMSAQAQRMMDEYGVKGKNINFSIAEPALGALTGNILGEVVDADEETKARMMAAGFVLGHFGNRMLMKHLTAQKPGMGVVSGQMSSQMSGKVDVPKYDKLKDVAKYISAYAKEHPVIPKGTRLSTPTGRETAVQAIADHTIAELEAHASTKPNDRSFYTTDITEFTNPAIQKLALERYGRKLTDAEIKLTHVLSALGSGESTPTMDTGYGLRVFDEYLRTGRATGHSEKPKPIYKAPAVGQDPLPVYIDAATGADTFVAKGNEPKYAPLVKAKISKTYNTSAVSRLNEIVDYFDGDMATAMDWLGTKHSFPEIQKVIGEKAAKALASHEYLDKKGESFGVFALGNNPKLGSYILNRWQNLDTITKDLWVARTTSRYFNEPNTGTPWATTKEGNYKRQMLDEAWGRVAKKLGIEPAQVQERMWAAERDLYEKMGMPKGSSYTSEGVSAANMPPFTEKPENIGRSGVMASPSVEDIQYPAAVEKLKSPEQENFRGLATKHAPGARIYDAIGDWLDGAENSLFLVFDKIQTPSKLKEIGARLGEAREQKAILWWHQDPAGSAALHEVTWPKGIDMKQARQILIDAGIENRTIINTPEGVKALIFDMDQSLVDRINKVKANELFPPTINSVPATGEFLGAATRPEAVRTYRDVLGQIEGRRSERGQAVGRSDVGPAGADAAVREVAAPKQTDTPEFKNWFGKSQLVDAQGKPTVLYHGTDKANLTKFTERPGGIWLAFDPRAAEPGTGSAAGSVLPLYAKAEKVYKLSDAEFKAFQNSTTPKRYVMDILGRKRMDGYDAVQVADYALVVNRATQVKSAIGNKGAFDPSNPDVRGAVNTQLLVELGKSAIGAIGGFAYGYSKGSDLPPEERVANALQWSLFGGLLASPLRSKAINVLRNTPIPVPTAMRSYLAGAENFYVFQKGMLKEVYDVMRTKSSETAALALEPMRAYEDLSRRMEKATAGDRLSVNNYMRGAGSSGNIIDIDLKTAAEKTRRAIDDLSGNWQALGIVKGGSDLSNAIVNNLGEYLNRSYELFENPKFKPDPTKINDFVVEYVRDELLNGSTTPIPELRQQGYEAALRIVAKGPGGALDSAAQFAVGGGISRGNGSVLKPRKALSDVTRELMGEIKDPVKQAGFTIDRMSHYQGAMLMQQQMREVGLKLGLFVERPTEGSPYTVPMKRGAETVLPDPVSGAVNRPEVADKLGLRGPLADLWTTPQVADALRSYQAYQDSSLMWKAITTVGAYSKISKTVQSIESYAPNFWSSWATMMGQGAFVSLATHPGSAVKAFKVLVDDVLPTSDPKLRTDINFLTKERVLNQNVNANDIVDNIRQSFVPDVSGKLATWIPVKASEAAGKAHRGLLNAYGKAEAFPRILGFYTEVARGRTMFPTAPESQIYLRAAERTRGAYPNTSELPEVIKKMSATGAMGPFVAYQYETFFRNPYNTMKYAMEDIKQGAATGNQVQLADGVLRASSLVGMVLGAMALNETFSQRAGTSPRQEEAIKRSVPEYDRDGMLVTVEMTPDSYAYANQSYIYPQALPASAIKAALDGVSPTDATLLAAKQLSAAAGIFGGNTWITPLKEAVTGRNAFGREIFPRDAGKFVSTEDITSRPQQDAAINAQRFLQGVEHVVTRGFMPNTINTAGKWVKAANEELGPDGQVYTMSDMIARVAGLRINRREPMRDIERRSKEIADRLTVAHQDVNRLARKMDTKPADMDAAYAMQETARKRIMGDIRLLVEDGVEMLQPKDKVIEAVRKSIPSDLLLGALNGYYVPGKQGKDPSLAERLATIEAYPKALQDAVWMQLKADDPIAHHSLLRAKLEASVKDKRGVTAEDELIVSMPSTDGTRARNLARYILTKSGDDPAQSDAVYTSLKKKGLVDPVSFMKLKDPLIWAEARASLKTGLATPAANP